MAEPLRNDEVDRIVLRGLGLNGFDGKVRAQKIARHFKLPLGRVEASLARLKRVRLARDRKANGEKVWERWR